MSKKETKEQAGECVCAQGNVTLVTCYITLHVTCYNIINVKGLAFLSYSGTDMT